MYTQEQIDQWKAEYVDIYAVDILDQSFIYRLIGRQEYEMILNMELSPGEHEEVICELATLYPEGFNFRVIAGYADTLGSMIMEASGLMQGQAQDLLQSYRDDMQLYDSQVDCVIHEAFPEFSIEEIPKWTIPKTMFYLSRAEWILQNLKGVSPQFFAGTQSQQAQSPQPMPPEFSEQLRGKVAEVEEKGGSNRQELSQAEVEAMLGVDLSKDSSKEGIYPELAWFKADTNLKGDID